MADRKKGTEGPIRWAADRVSAAQRSFKAFFDSSGIGEGITSALLVLVILVAVVFSMPDGVIRELVGPRLNWLAQGVSLEQAWSMFAPNPPRRNEDLEVRVTMADGTQRSFSIIEQMNRYDKVFGQAVSHRWQKIMENAVIRPQLRPDIAHWVVGQVTKPGERPAHVVMTLHLQVMKPPGQSGTGPSGEEILYDEQLPGHA